jgi:hypothetical protein
MVDIQTLTGSKYDGWFWFDFCCFNATFSNISVISWRPVLVVEEAGVPGENHRPWTSNWYTLSLAAASREHPFCYSQSRARTHAALVIGLYELLGNPLGPYNLTEEWMTRISNNTTLKFRFVYKTIPKK